MSLRGPPPPLGTPLGAACARRSSLDEVLAAGMAHTAIEPTSTDSDVDPLVEIPALSTRQLAAKNVRVKKDARDAARGKEWWDKLVLEIDEEGKEQPQKEKAPSRRFEAPTAVIRWDPSGNGTTDPNQDEQLPLPAGPQQRPAPPLNDEKIAVYNEVLLIRWQSLTALLARLGQVSPKTVFWASEIKWVESEMQRAATQMSAVFHARTQE